MKLTSIFQTGKLRMDDAQAGALFEIVYPEFCRELTNDCK